MRAARLLHGGAACPTPGVVDAAGHCSPCVPRGSIHIPNFVGLRKGEKQGWRARHYQAREVLLWASAVRSGMGATRQKGNKHAEKGK